MRLHALLALSLLTTQGLASPTPQNELCITSIYTAYAYIPFALSSRKRKLLDAKCTNTLSVISIYASAEIYCNRDERELGLEALGTLCAEGGLELIPRERLRQNLTDDAVSEMRTVEFGEVPMTETVYEPVLLSKSHYGRVFWTLDTWAYEVWTHHTYGYLGYAYWALILTIGAAHRIAQYCFTVRNRSSSRHILYSNHPLQKIYHWLQTNLLVPTSIPSQGRNVLFWTFTNRAEGIVVLGFWVLSVTVSVISYRLDESNIYWPSLTTQLTRYTSDRTGILSFANLPLIWLFAGRNNICSWLTGWNFATLNVFHRHVAWIACLQAVVHTGGYILLFFDGPNPWRKLTKPYLVWGTLATALMVLILPAAVNWFRHRAYETFLLFHIILSIGVLVGCFYHTIIFKGQEYWAYLYPPVGIWLFDRTLRVTRVVYCNFHVRFNANSNLISCTKSTAIYDPAANLITLETTPGSNCLKPRAGEYYFLYQPFRVSGWESHPFTVGAWTHDQGGGREKAQSYSPLGRNANVYATKTSSEAEIDVSQIPLLSDDSSSNSRSAQTLSQRTHSRSRYGCDSPSRPLKLIFWIRPYDGWTRKLRDTCIRASASADNQTTAQSPRGVHSPVSVPVTMLLEGPYGHESPLHSYESVLLIAGGTGIASAVPYVRDYIERQRPRSAFSKLSGCDDDDAPDIDSSSASADQAGSNEAATRITSMRLVWTTRQPAFVHALASQEEGLRTALGRSDFHAEFYATALGSGQPARTGLAGESWDGHGAPAATADPSAGMPPANNSLSAEANSGIGVEITHGRPDLESIISTFAEEAHLSNSSAAVLVCGPGKMADEARQAVHSALKRGMSVRYVEESFSW